MRLGEEAQVYVTALLIGYLTVARRSNLAYLPNGVFGSDLLLGQDVVSPKLLIGHVRVFQTAVGL